VSLNISLSHRYGTIRKLGYGLILSGVFSRFDTIHERDRHAATQRSHDIKATLMHSIARQKLQDISSGPLHVFGLLTHTQTGTLKTIPAFPIATGILPLAMHKRGICRHAVSVRTCVCLSVTFEDSVKTSNRIIWLCSPWASHTILVFPSQTWQYSDANSPNRGVECRWGRQKSRFWACIWLHCVLWTLRPATCYQHAYRGAAGLLHGPASCDTYRW